MDEYAIGERVLAATNGTGNLRPGVVTGVLSGVVADYIWDGRTRYMVRFDGDAGPSGPCAEIRSEGESEAVPPRSGTAA